MYKVFFKDRTVYFGDDFSKAFLKNKGLFYKFSNLQELNELIEAFFMLKRINNLYIFHDDILTLVEEFKACFNFVEAAGGLVTNKKGEFLIMMRDGIWDLPKGKLDKGEDYQTAALREVEEEVGLSGLRLIQQIVSTYHTYHLSEDRVLKKTKWFEICYDGDDIPKPQLSEKITEIRWVKPGETDFIRKNTYPSVLDVLYVKGML
ncbi:MAG TPA: NUDIX domain-containing protein [Bacteroidaceae bacterium]|nr:NUDIX domain-containing protein [Bacteroidaceae bacterium]